MTLRDTQESAVPTTQKLEFSAAEIGALAHLYRGEVYRSTACHHELGGGYDGHCAVRDFQQCASLAFTDGARWSDCQCVPSVRGAPLPVFQCLAGTHAFTRD